MPQNDNSKRDPRRLRALMDRAFVLMSDHEMSSVFLGVVGEEGDLMVPEFIAFLESELRVEDSIFSMTRERAVVLLADVGLEQAQQIVERLQVQFAERFPASRNLEVLVRYHPVEPGGAQPAAKVILPALFAPAA